MIRVLISTRSTAFSLGLQAILSQRDSLRVITPDPIQSSLSLPEQLEDLRPDVVVVDALDQDLSESSLETGGIPLVVIPGDPLPPWTWEVWRSSIRAILPEDSTPEELGAAIEAVAAGWVVISPEMMESLLPEMLNLSEATLSSPLTAREMEVLTLVAEGVGNKTIAKRLGISEHTVKFHVGSIFTKLNVSSRTEAVRVGARQGMILL